MKYIEIEQKYRIRRPDAIRSRLRPLRAKILRSGYETNEFYDCRDRLSRGRSILRLRQIGRGHAELAFKGPRLKSRYSKRREVETPVRFDEMKKILTLAGFTRVRRYRKHRTLYRTSSCDIALDRVPQMGWFVEIEGLPSKIRDMELRLGLSKRDREHRTYLEMLFS